WGKEVENSIGMKLVRIPAGTFTMGSPADEKDRETFEKGSEQQHEVEITKDFYLGKYLVTKMQFARFVEAAKYQTEAETDGKGGSGYDGKDFKYDPEYTWRDPGFTQGDNHPVVNVSWNDATELCKWASGATKRRIVLPTEAQWEYACRAGTTTRNFTGDKAESLDGSANVADRTFKKQFPNLPSGDIDDGYVFTSPVAKFRPNPFGLYDMTGNAGEWCADYYDDKYYKTSDKKDPENITKTDARVLRGGSWYRSPGDCRAAYRNRGAPASRGDGVGCRVCLSLN
ncbi:MAG TPA: formylglycine-generating enzyme family protein, partial [Gemmataceae bacterium]|nr:formylglycine-generating enzyme family protein [Gemmataceae bacterium]